MESVNTMLHGFQEPSESYDSLTQDLEKQAPKKDDFEVAMSTPDASGMVHFGEDKPAKASPGFEDDFSEDTVFVQEPAEWTPAGQDGLASAISDMKDADEEEALKEDQLKGHGVLSAIGMQEDEDPMETIFVQEEATWEPQGQDGMAKDIESAKSQEAADEAEENHLRGETVLSAVGITQDDDNSINYDDISDEDLGLVQVSATADDDAWVPKGQPGLANQIRDTKDSDEENEMKEDGLKGHSMLSAAGVGETEFLQQDAVSSWKPKGQAVKKVKSYDNAQSDTEEDEFEHDEKYMDDGIEGDDMLSAVGMGDHLKPTDEVGELGTLKAEDLDLDLV